MDRIPEVGMKRFIGLVIAAVAVACSAGDAATIARVADPSTPISPSPEVAHGDEADRVTACEERVAERGHVNMGDIAPAMLEGTRTEAGSWHLEASRSITFWWCHRETRVEPPRGSG
jgi:hypothetical protein